MQATQVLPQQIGETISFWSRLCAQVHRHTETVLSQDFCPYSVIELDFCTVCIWFHRLFIWIDNRSCNKGNRPRILCEHSQVRIMGMGIKVCNLTAKYGKQTVHPKLLNQFLRAVQNWLTDRPAVCSVVLSLYITVDVNEPGEHFISCDYRL